MKKADQEISNFMCGFINKNWGKDIATQSNMTKQDFLYKIKTDTEFALSNFVHLASNGGPLKKLWVYMGPPDDFSQVYSINNKYIMITKSLSNFKYKARFCEKKTKVITYFE